MSVYDTLTDPHSPAVIATLKQRCIICGAKPSQPCTSITAHALQGRIVHYARIPMEVFTA